MIETTTESNYLRKLAAWFEHMSRSNDFDISSQNCGEVAAHLCRIAEKLRLLEAHEHLITARKDDAGTGFNMTALRDTLKKCSK